MAQLAGPRGQPVPTPAKNDKPLRAEGVERILNDCAISSGAHKASAKLLWQIQSEAPKEFFDRLLSCLKHALLVFKGDASVDRVIRFVIAFCTQHPRDREEDCMSVVEQLMSELLGLCTAVDRAVRFRVCQLLAGIFNNLPESAEITEELADALEAAMLERTKDKVPVIRSSAIRALSRLADPGDDGKFETDPITGAFLQALAADKNKDVRKCIIVSLTPCPRTLEPILERVRDVNEEVRRTVFVVVKDKIPLMSLSVAQRTSLLEAGLGDRCASVSKATGALLETWLERECKGSVLALLRALGTPNNEDIPSQALRHLLTSGAVDAVAITQPDRAADTIPGGATLSGLCESKALLAPEAALFWRVVCEFLNSNAKAEGGAAAGTYGAASIVKAAVAGEFLDALDRALPETAEGFMQYIKLQAEDAEDCGGNSSGAGRGFVVRQLVLVASRCLDFADGQGRAAFHGLLRDLVRKPAAAGLEGAAAQKRREALEELSAQVLPEPADLADLVLGSVDAMVDDWGLLGDDAAGQKADSEDEEEKSEDDGPLEQQRWCCVLEALGMLLRQWPGRRSDASGISLALVDRVEESVQSLVLSAAQHDQEPVRKEAVRVLGLYCLLGAQLDVQPAHVSLLVLALERDSEPVQAVAARALCDLALFRGHALRSASALPDQVTSADDNGTGEGSQQGAREVDVIKLLMDTLNSSFAVSSGEDGDGKEAYGVVAEGLAKLLMHHGMPGGNSALQDGDAVRILVSLLLLHFSPGTEDLSRARQCLAVALDAYSRLHPGSQRLLADAFLPAARQAALLYPNQKKAAARNAAASLVRFMTQLLQAQAPGQQHQGQDQDEEEEEAADNGGSLQGSNGRVTHEALAERILNELFSIPKCSGSKSYVAALCKALQSLPLGASSPVATKRLRALSDRLMDEGRLDGASAKDAKAFLERVVSLDPSPEESLPEDELEALLESIKMQDLGPELLELFGSGAPQRGGRAKHGSAAAGRRRRGKAGQESDDDEDEIVSLRGGAPAERRQLPSRRARPQQAPLAVDISTETSDSEEDDEDSDHSPAEVRKGAGLHASHQEDGGSDSESDPHSEDFQNPPPRASPASAKNANPKAPRASRSPLGDANAIANA